MESEIVWDTLSLDVTVDIQKMRDIFRSAKDTPAEENLQTRVRRDREAVRFTIQGVFWFYCFYSQVNNLIDIRV